MTGTNFNYILVPGTVFGMLHPLSDFILAKNNKDQMHKI